MNHSKLQSHKYHVYFRYIPFQASVQYNSADPESPQDCIVPHQLYAYTAEDAVFQAQLIFLHGRPAPGIKPYDDLGRDYHVIRVEPADRI